MISWKIFVLTEPLRPSPATKKFTIEASGHLFLRSFRRHLVWTLRPVISLEFTLVLVVGSK